MAILEDIWNGFCDFVNYLWCNGDLVAFVILAAISMRASVTASLPIPAENSGILISSISISSSCPL